MLTQADICRYAAIQIYRYTYIYRYKYIVRQTETNTQTYTVYTIAKEQLSSQKESPVYPMYDMQITEFSSAQSQNELGVMRQ